MADIVDQYGRPIERAGKRPDRSMLAAVPTRQKFNDYPSRGLTPDRLARILRDADDGDVTRQYELFAEMEEKDAHLAAVLGTRKLAVQGLARQIRPSSDDPRAQRAAEVVEDALAEIDLDAVILDLMDAVGKGVSVLEIGWDTGAVFRPYTIEQVDADLLQWDGRHLQLTDGYGANARPLPPNKFMVHAPKLRSGIPSRGGMLRVVTWLYLFKNYTIKDWVTFAEVFAMPLRVGKYEPGSDKGDVEKLQAALAALASDSAAVIPNNAVIEFISKSKADGGGADVYERFAEYCDRGISKAILGQTLTTDTSGGTGTRAAGAVHDAVRHDIRNADASAMAQTMRRDLFRPIVGFNLGWDYLEHTPLVELDTSEPEDQAALATTYKTLTADIGLKVPVSSLYERFRIPEPAEGEETVGGRQDMAAPRMGLTPMKQCACGGLALKAGEEFSPGQRAIESLIAATIEEGQTPLEEIMQPFLDAVDEAESFEDLERRLLEAYPTVSTDKFRDLVERAVAMGAAVGYEDAGRQQGK